jgi:hypothetical protein
MHEPRIVTLKLYGVFVNICTTYCHTSLLEQSGNYLHIVPPTTANLKALRLAECICFACFYEQMSIIFPCVISRLVFEMKLQCVYCELGTQFLCINSDAFRSLKGTNS